MAQTEVQLAQSRPAVTTLNSIYSPASGRAIITQLVVVNTSAAGAKMQLCHDDNGTTYDESTALYWDLDVGAKETILVRTNMAIDAAGNIAFSTDTANALTITLYGMEITS